MKPPWHWRSLPLPVFFLSWVPRLSHYEVSLYLHLLERSWGREQPSVSIRQPELMTLVGCARATLQRALYGLEDVALIRITRHRSKPSTYEVLEPSPAPD